MCTSPSFLPQENISKSCCIDCLQLVKKPMISSLRNSTISSTVALKYPALRGLYLFCSMSFFRSTQASTIYIHIPRYLQSVVNTLSSSGFSKQPVITPSSNLPNGSAESRTLILSSDDSAVFIACTPAVTTQIVCSLISLRLLYFLLIRHSTNFAIKLSSSSISSFTL